MAVYNNGLPFSNLGALQVAVGEPPSSATRGGYGIAVDRTGTLAYVTAALAAVPDTAVIHGGLAMTPSGALYVTEDVTGMDYYANGFRVRADGAVLVVQTTDASDTYNGGWACELATGARTVNGTGGDGATFAVEFNDLGAGEANLVPTFGGVTPTFTRATAATTIGSNGLVISVATGVPRSYYDPTTLEYLGYLAEGARTNIALQSEDFATTWTNGNSTESTNAAVSPDGATTADKLIPDAASAQGRLTQNVTLTAGQTYTISVFAKQADSSFVNTRLAADDGGVTSNASVTYNCATGAVLSAAAVVGNWTAPSSTAKQYPNGWWRFTLTFTCTTDAGARIQVWNNQTGDGTSGIYIWGYQAELGAFASSYIPTTTAAVTRNADVLTYPTTGWLNASAGTLLVNAQSFSTGNTARIIASLNDGTSSNRILNYLGGTLITPTALITAGGVSQATLTRTAVGINVSTKQAIAYIENDIAFSANSETPATDAAATIPTVVRLDLSGSTGSSSFELFGPIRRVQFYSVRLPNATLQALTA